MARSANNRRSAAKADDLAKDVELLSVGWREGLIQRPTSGFFIESIKVGCAGSDSIHRGPPCADEQSVCRLCDAAPEISAGITGQRLYQLPICSGVFVQEHSAGGGITHC